MMEFSIAVSIAFGLMFAWNCYLEKRIDEQDEKIKSIVATANKAIANLNKKIDEMK